MRSFGFFEDHSISALNPWIAAVLMVAFVFGTAGQAAAQTSRYNIDDVMDKLIEMDKNVEVRLGKLEIEVSGIEKRMDKLEKRMDKLEETQGRQLWIMLAFIFAVIGILIANNYKLGKLDAHITGGAEEKAARRAEGEAEGEMEKQLKLLAEQVKEVSDREKELEEKLTAAEVI